MGKLVKNKNLNYWICGLIFSIIYGLIGAVVSTVGKFAAVIGIFLYIIIMPYITGRLADYVSDKWMD